MILVNLGATLIGVSCSAQVARVRVCVQDGAGRGVPGAHLTYGKDPVTSVLADSQGCATVTPTGSHATSVLVQAEGFAPAEPLLGSGTAVKVSLRPAGRSEQIEVTATRTPLALDATASSVRVLSAEQLGEAPGFALDDRLRQIAGFQLFRRTSSWVANPTTQGTSLRGLASTAASRTLVLSDQVPLNDAFGGWIHWNEIPQLAVQSVELMRGGASDLYGSSAIGGVIDVVPVEPKRLGYAMDLAGASQYTSDLNGLLTGTLKQWSGLGTATLFRTDGYTLTAPEVRGRVDTNANVHSQSGRVEFRRSIGAESDVFLRGNLLNEARGNGTPLQTNGTRIWRYNAGGDWVGQNVGRLLLRLHGSDQGYRQTFSSIAANRDTEQLIRFQQVPSQQLGASMQWAKSARSLTFVAGSDVLDTRGTDSETPISRGNPGATTSINARQRQVGVYGEVLWQPVASNNPLLRGWSLALSSRVDQFQSFDGRSILRGVATSLPETSETVFDPRLGVVKQVVKNFSLNASVFRAFRGPTLNELYRSSQVGQQLTRANPNLRSERATGFETGGLVNLRGAGSVRASYFWTEVNRPIAALTVSSTPTSVLQMRQNLGQLQSKGIQAEWQIQPVRSLQFTGGYQYAVSTVTRFDADPTLVGRWTPQVARNVASLQIRGSSRRWGVATLDLRNSGRQYEDSGNTMQLHSYFQVNAYVEHSFGEHVSVYGSGQNLLDRRIEAGKTPLLTLGSPRVVLGGVRFH